MFDVGVDRDQIVPGLQGHLQLIAPDTFTRHEIVIGVTPPSMNTDEVRGWRAFARTKKAWQERLQSELMVAKFPKRNAVIIAGAVMRFPRGGRRDSGNFGHVLDKALGDALTFSGDPSRPADLRYIADDTPRYYYFAGVEFEQEPGPHRTRIVLFTLPEEETHGS